MSSSCAAAVAAAAGGNVCSLLGSFEGGHSFSNPSPARLRCSSRLLMKAMRCVLDHSDSGKRLRVPWIFGSGCRRINSPNPLSPSRLQAPRPAHARCPQGRTESRRCRGMDHSALPPPPAPAQRRRRRAAPGTTREHPRQCQGCSEQAAAGGGAGVHVGRVARGSGVLSGWERRGWVVAGGGGGGRGGGAGAFFSRGGGHGAHRHQV